ncbi:hypothetical protein PG991_015282 [Apiospora marii]|uniref:Secreted protein n=1 Tax=Apiospora marii TaxID=335849 RepID=A0ABR1R196_9PEZI
MKLLLVCLLLDRESTLAVVASFPLGLLLGWLLFGLNHNLVEQLLRRTKRGVVLAVVVVVSVHIHLVRLFFIGLVHVPCAIDPADEDVAVVGDAAGGLDMGRDLLGVGGKVVAEHAADHGVQGADPGLELLAVRGLAGLVVGVEFVHVFHAAEGEPAVRLRQDAVAAEAFGDPALLGVGIRSGSHGGSRVCLLCLWLLEPLRVSDWI